MRREDLDWLNKANKEAEIEEKKHGDAGEPKIIIDSPKQIKMTGVILLPQTFLMVSIKDSTTPRTTTFSIPVVIAISLTMSALVICLGF